MSGSYTQPNMPVANDGEEGIALPNHQHGLAPAVALTDAATIAVNAALGFLFRVTLAGNRTLGAPSNPTDGQVIDFEITQGSGGSHTLAYASAYEFSTTLVSPTLSTTAGDVDLLSFRYSSVASKWRCVRVVLGSAS